MDDSGVEHLGSKSLMAEFRSSSALYWMSSGMGLRPKKKSTSLAMEASVFAAVSAEISIMFVCKYTLSRLSPHSPTSPDTPKEER
mmetsp:Transcript_48081/g.112563  ORF Transcript_48081/g.112563 Transcript_48081/m.112563 type:complete len:85 (-) Transcript_48081:50-304(-)